MNHLIQKQTIDLQITANEEAFKLQQTVSQLYWEKVVPALEVLFDQIVGPDELIQIDQLELNLGHLTKKELLDDTFIQRLSSSVEKQLHQLLKTPSNDVRRIPVQQGYFQQWLFFLEKGYLEQPQNEPETIRLEAVLKTLKKGTKAKVELQILLHQYPLALERLILQHPVSFLKNIIEIYTQQTQEKLITVLAEVYRLKKSTTAIPALVILQQMDTQQLKHTFWKSMIQTAILRRSSRSWQLLVKGFLENLFPLHALSFLKKSILSSSKTPLINQVLELKKTNLPSKENTADSIQDKNNPVINQEDISSTLDKKIKAETPESETAQKNDLEETPLNSPKKLAHILDADKKQDKKKLNEEQHVSKNRDKKTIATEDILKGHQKNKKPKTDEKNQNEKAPQKTEPQTLKTDQQKAKKTQDETVEKSQANQLETELNVPIKPHIQENKQATESSKANIQQKDDITIDKTKPKPIPPSEINKGPKWLSPEERRAQSKGTIIKTNTQIFIKNAGVVLLHPYLKHYYKSIELTQNHQFVSEAARHKAVILLHYIATGETDLPEYEMLLPKLLCDVPFDVPIDRHIELQASELEEAENMMKIVLDHWGALGNVSTDSLRVGFLERDGKLTKKESGWHLQVERKTLDILLNRLPWGLGVIKLPWKKGILQVEWA